MSEPDLGRYEFIFYARLGKLYDVEDISQILEGRFTFVKVLVPVRKTLMTFIRPAEIWDCVPEFLFKADTLYAAVSPSRVVLFQKTDGPFTEKDVELRAIIRELYSFPIKLPFLAREPKFETQARPPRQ